MHAVLSERELVRHLVDGVGATEIAARFGLNEQQVRELVTRTLRNLREQSRRMPPDG